MSYVDGQIRKLVQGLEDLGLWDNTILIVTGDHGEALGEDGVYEHPWHYMEDELLRVPLLIRAPGADTDRISTPLSLAWLHELIGELTAAGPAPLPAESPYDSILTAPSAEESIVVSDSVSTEGYSIMIRDSEYRYVRHYLNSEVDYIDDKEIITRISDGDSELTSREASQERFRGIVEDYLIRPGDVPELGSEIGSEAREHLEELGYI